MPILLHQYGQVLVQMQQDIERTEEFHEWRQVCSEQKVRHFTRYNPLMPTIQRLPDL